ncbi:nuclear pore complex protein Nup50 [Macrosteles quadrilineatus]|uniref:nuclear pore complex protein Nup50 n=1 Tax=Macrosteles quadrilineatus TaxID=74068 RepID=UPI0023E1B3DF|nr:nuclear pore complex protein Nup50 [Macrosteles quadrilineatus]
MAKRTATTDLNHDNWDQEVESEEAGTFKTASADLLQKRAIKVARRRVKTSESSEAGKSLFAGFTGFKPSTPSLNPSSNSKTSFGFLSNSTSSSTSTPSTNGTTITPMSTEVTAEQKYLSNLQELNKSVSTWIKSCVDKNPGCILTPVFKDYEKYLKELEDDRDTSKKAGTTVVSSAPKTLSSFSFVSSSTSDNKFAINVPKTSESSSTKTFTFVDSNKKTDSTDSTKFEQSLFGVKESESGTGRSPMLQDDSTKKPSVPSIFGGFNSDSSGSSFLKKPDPASLMINPFTSSLSKPATDNSSIPASSRENKEDEEEEESDEPPKVEVKPIEEKGSVFSTRCKVFVKKDSNYKDKGVGTLYIKKVDEERHQLLVRAETVLGNVLLNVLLSSGVPTQRMGKNNVMLVCLPTPQDPPPPTTVLLRVKTAEEADNLLSTIDKYKPSN